MGKVGWNLCNIPIDIDGQDVKIMKIMESYQLLSTGKMSEVSNILYTIIDNKVEQNSGKNGKNGQDAVVFGYTKIQENTSKKGNKLNESPITYMDNQHTIKALQPVLYQTEGDCDIANMKFDYIMILVNTIQITICKTTHNHPMNIEDSFLCTNWLKSAL